MVNGPFTKLAIFPNGKFIACFTQNGHLLVVSSDFGQSLTDFDTKSKMPPTQMIWCGGDAVVLYWEKVKDEGIALVCGPSGR